MNASRSVSSTSVLTLSACVAAAYRPLTTGCVVDGGITAFRR